MSLTIHGALALPNGKPVTDGSVTLVWGTAAPQTSPLGADGGFSFTVGSGRGTVAGDSGNASTTRRAAGPEGESAPPGRGDTGSLDGGDLGGTRGVTVPATVALRYDGKDLVFPRGLGQMLISGGETWSLGVIVYYEFGVELLHPRGTFYGLPAAPRDALTRPVLQDSKAIGDVLTDAGQQLDGATGNLASTSYDLGSVDLKIKGALGEDGLAFLAEDGLTRVDSGHLSEVSAGFTPTPGGGVRPGGSAVVPDLSGYTRVLAQRKLAVAGLVPEFSAQTVIAGARSTAVGRVVAQDPAAGAGVDRGAKVRVFIGKAAPPPPNVRTR